MTTTGLTKLDWKATFTGMKRLTAIAAFGVSGCISVSAPDKPIEINLNIKVTQEVVYRLDGDAKALIQSNPGIF